MRAPSAFVGSARRVWMCLWQSRGRGGSVRVVLLLGDGLSLFSWILDDALRKARIFFFLSILFKHIEVLFVSSRVLAFFFLYLS